MSDTTPGPERVSVPALSVFVAFLKLGLVSFGGPLAHLGYFRRELVERRRWLAETDYAELVALCQFLPGPASSQTGFAIGLRLAGPAGGLAAFAGFTLPSALLMLAAAFGLRIASGAETAALIHGLKLVAVSVVAHAVFSMARANCRSLVHAGFAAAALGVLLLFHHPLLAPAVILIAAAAGALSAGGARGAAPPGRSSVRSAAILFAVFLGLLAGLPILRAVTGSGGVAVADTFYRAGALVFGGGHVVLPLLQAETAMQVPTQDFLAGYGVAQALPGPLFSFAAYLGALWPSDAPSIASGLIALLAIFLPGFLLVAAADPLWRTVRGNSRAVGAVALANAAVVGVLAAAWWDPVATSTVRSPIDAIIAALGFIALLWRRAPVIAVVAAVALLGALQAAS